MTIAEKSAERLENKPNIELRKAETLFSNYKLTFYIKKA